MQQQQQQQQMQQQQQQQQQMLMTPTRITVFSSRPKFAPYQDKTPTRQISPQISPHSKSPGNVYHLSLKRTCAQNGSKGANVRHDPYTVARPRKPNFETQNQTQFTHPSRSIALPTDTIILTTGSMVVHKDPENAQSTNQNQIIKLEPMDNVGNGVKSTVGSVSYSPVDSQSSLSTIISKPSEAKFSDMQPSGAKYHDIQPSGSKYSDMQPPGAKYSDMQPPGAKYSDMQPSDAKYSDMQPSGAKYSDMQPSRGLGLDSDNPNLPGKSASASDNVSVKVEAISESDFELEITGVEPGHMAQSEHGSMPNNQTDMDYDSVAQGGMGDQSNQGQSKSFFFCLSLCLSSFQSSHIYLIQDYFLEYSRVSVRLAVKICLFGFPVNNFYGPVWMGDIGQNLTFRYNVQALQNNPV